jgi:hypothetical protein
MRLAAGLTAKDAAAKIHRAETSLTRMERAESSLDPLKIKPLLRLYGVDSAEARKFLADVKEAAKPGWWAGFHDVLPPGFTVYVSFETEAQQIRSYEPTVAPGLLQTADYCESLLRLGFPEKPPRDVARMVELRMTRQELLARSDAPLLWVVMDEYALARPAADPPVMRKQIDHLIEQSRKPNISLQILPFSHGTYHGAFGPYSIFRFDEFPDVVALENLEGTEYREGQETVEIYRATFDNLSNAALEIDKTEDFLARAKEKYR